MPNPTTPPLARGNDPLSQLAFWRDLVTQNVATNDDATHALLLFIDGQDPHPDYARRVEALSTRRIWPRNAGAPGEGVTRGSMAYAISAILNLRGGVTMRLLGNSERYALRELQFRGLMPQSSANQGVTGNELVGLISKADDWRETHSTDASAVVRNSPEGHSAPPAAPVEQADTPMWLAGTSPKLLTLVTPLLASMQSEPAPSTKPVNEVFSAKVAEVARTAQWKRKGDAEWVLLKAGDILPREASIHTGPGARVRLIMPQGQIAVIYALTNVTLLELRLNQGKVQTDIGMTNGRVEYEIINQGVKYDATVRAPNTTLAVRSTRILLYEQPPFVPEAFSLTGRAEFFRKSTGVATALGGTNGKVRARADRSGAAETALGSAVVDPSIAAARTNSESALIANLISRGASVSFDPIAGIRTITGGSALRESTVVSTLPGKVNFVLTWTSAQVSESQPPAGNVDLSIANQFKEVLLPLSGFDSSPSGGRVLADNRGGGVSGIEIIYWPKSAPSGFYELTATALTGPAADVTLRAYDAAHNPLSISTNDSRASVHHESVVGTITPDRKGGTGAALTAEVFVPSNDPAEQQSVRSTRPKAAAVSPHRP